MRLVIIESPFAAPDAAGVEANVAYARKAMLDSLRRGEAPYASHLLFPQVLDDADPDQRKQGIEAGLAWGRRADATAVYADRGITSGMRQGIADAIRQGRTVFVRWLDVLGEPIEMKATRAEQLVHDAAEVIVHQIAATQSRIDAAKEPQHVEIIGAV